MYIKPITKYTCSSIHICIRQVPICSLFDIKSGCYSFRIEHIEIGWCLWHLCNLESPTKNEGFGMVGVGSDTEKWFRKSQTTTARMYKTPVNNGRFQVPKLSWWVDPGFLPSTGMWASPASFGKKSLPQKDVVYSDGVPECHSLFTTGSYIFLWVETEKLTAKLDLGPDEGPWSWWVLEEEL